MKDISLSLSVGTWSDRGSRQRNEDFCLQDTERGLFAIADGVGGMPYGDVMARYCCHAALDSWVSDKDFGLEERLRMTFETVASHAAQTSRWLGDAQSSTTLLFCTVEDDTFGIASVGDCAAYLVRGNTCTSLVRMDRFPEGNHVITQAMGLASEMDPSFFIGKLEDADVLLLCTDGAWENLDEDAVPALCQELIFNESKIARQICQLSDGSDNATVIAIVAHTPIAPQSDCIDQPTQDSDV